MLTKRKETKPDGEIRYINLTKSKSAIVDAQNYERLKQFYWRAVKSNVCWYAVTRTRINGKIQNIKMHRLIAKTPVDMVCHHYNHNSLDNREANLVNLTLQEHEALHGGRVK